MTIREKMHKRLVGHGMFPDQAYAVLELAKAHPILPDMDHRWNDDVSDYPESFPVVIWLSVKLIALDWIDANKPKAWFRPMFADYDTCESRGAG